MSELIGTLAGILIGFGLDRTYIGYKDRKHKQELKVNFKEELTKRQELLTGKGNLLPIAMWNSAISSGDIGLLSFTDRTKLSSLYFEIDNYNYETKRLRDVSAIVNSSHNNDAQTYWKSLTVSMMNNDQLLKAKITKMLEEQLWNKKRKTTKK